MTSRRATSHTHLALALALALAAARPARAVFWNDDPAFGVTSLNGLTDRPLWFSNDYRLYNDANSTRGTCILLNSEWALTVHHVVQSAAGYNPITTPDKVSVYVDGIGGYFADQVFVPSDGSEIALVHLRGGVNSALNLLPAINTSFDENNRIVQIGGFGYYGLIATTAAGGTVTATSNTDASFHRAYNTIQGFNSLGQIQISANGESALRTNGLLEGIAGPGDSGGPMFAFYGTNFATQQNDPSQWRLVGLTATSAAGTSAAWNQSSQYTRIANYSSWINSTMASLPTPAPATTAAWVQDSGTNLYLAAGNKFSVTNSAAAPVVHAHFGPAAGYTLASIGDKLQLSATLDTPLAMASIQFRFGMFDDANGTLPGNIAGGTPWRGYLVANSAENDPRPLFEKGPNGGGLGSWWSLVSPNTGNPVGSPSQAAGSFTAISSGTADPTPAGLYSLSLTYTRLASGLQIDWSLSQISDSAEVLNPATGLYQHNPTAGVYAYSGTALDTTPASSTWTYDQAGFFLYGGSMTNTTIIVDNINVAFSPVPEPATLTLLLPLLLLARRR